MKSIIILGGGGHASVVLDALQCAGASVTGFVDIDQKKKLNDLLHLGDDSVILECDRDEVLLANGLGSVGLPGARLSRYLWFKEKGYAFTRVIHPTSIIADDAVLGEGVQVMAGAVVQPGTIIGDNTIVNTRSSVDHDCEIGAHVHIAPGVTLSGQVIIGEKSHIGTGTSIIQGIRVGSGSLVGAGSVVIRPVADDSKVWGVPAKVQEKIGPV